MSKPLSLPDGALHSGRPATAAKLAQRMLCASREIAAALPAGFYATTALDILLMLYVAEEDASYPAWESMDVPGEPSMRTVDRWIAALTNEGLVDRQNGLIALSQKGYALVVATIGRIDAAQRALD